MARSQRHQLRRGDDRGIDLPRREQLRPRHVRAAGEQRDIETSTLETTRRGGRVETAELGLGEPVELEAESARPGRRRGVVSRVAGDRQRRRSDQRRAQHDESKSGHDEIVEAPGHDSRFQRRWRRCR